MVMFPLWKEMKNQSENKLNFLKEIESLYRI